MTLILTEVDENTKYVGPFGLTMEREYGNSPNGNLFNGRWVLRAGDGYIDHDQYRSDLMERNDLTFDW